MTQRTQQVISPFDVSFDGFGRATALLRSRGISVSQSWLPLPQLLNSTEPCGSVLVLTMAMQRSYSEAELDAMEQWVNRGGGQLVLAEPDDMFGVATMQNAVLMKHGLVVLSGQLRASEYYNVSGGMLAETIETTKSRQWLPVTSAMLKVLHMCTAL